MLSDMIKDSMGVGGGEGRGGEEEEITQMTKTSKYIICIKIKYKILVFENVFSNL